VGGRERIHERAHAVTGACFDASELATGSEDRLLPHETAADRRGREEPGRDDEEAGVGGFSRISSPAEDRPQEWRCSHGGSGRHREAEE
jgi:hypothetical protein